jgi:hypothetical protein
MTSSIEFLLFQGTNKLVPFLVPEPVCEDVPREVCTFGVKSTSQASKPLITKWCLKPGRMDVRKKCSKKCPKNCPKKCSEKLRIDFDLLLWSFQVMSRSRMKLTAKKEAMLPLRVHPKASPKVDHKVSLRINRKVSLRVSLRVNRKAPLKIVPRFHPRQGLKDHPSRPRL